MLPSRQFRHAVLLTAALTLASAAPAQSDGGLKTVNPPGGGTLVYGPVQNQTSTQGCFVAVLRSLHQHFGDKPQIGNVFQSRDGSSYGLFFTVAAHTQNNAPTAGLVLIFPSHGSTPGAAVLFDQSSRFAKSEPSLMRALNADWHSAAATPTSAPSPNTSSHGPKGGEGVPPLTPTHFPDGSGAISLPSGWRITFAQKGAVKVLGPHGETVMLGNSFGPIYDPSNPRVQMQMRYARPGQGYFCPNNGPLATYECVAKGVSVQVIRQQQIPAQSPGAQAILIDAYVDFHDGHGEMSCELGITNGPVLPMGNRTLGINGTCAPRSEMPGMQPTLKAIYDSYSINDQVVTREYQQDQRNSIAAGNAARTQANAAHAKQDAQSAAFQAHMDDIDRTSKGFQNYLLDQTQLQSNSLNARGAVPNNLANALIQANPNEFQAVPTSQFVKGWDF